MSVPSTRKKTIVFTLNDGIPYLTLLVLKFDLNESILLYADVSKTCWMSVNSVDLIFYSIQSRCIATDKRGYPHNIFLISPRKNMLWVLIRSASARRF